MAYHSIGSVPTQSRKILGTPGKAIELPNLYRIWQSVEGEVDTFPVLSAVGPF